MLKTQCENARKTLLSLASSSGEARNTAIAYMAKELVENSDYLIAENKKDLDNAKARGITEAMLDRLTLTKERINGIAASQRKLIALPDPLGSGEQWVRPNGLSIRRARVPLGLIAIIYEARPNVTADAAALCIKSGNAVILRGGSEAIRSNLAIVSVLRSALQKAGLDPESLQIVADTSRETATELMRQRGLVDLLIPRGGKSLIKSVTENATVPVIETGAGNCHVYFDYNANKQMALDIILNAKTSRPSVCNAAESLLVHKDIAAEILPLVKQTLVGVELRGCEKTLSILPDTKKATDEDFYTEYNDYILSIKIVADVAEAVDFINQHSTGHSEAIITNDLKNAEYFTSGIDSAAVYVNASTRFTDGEEFGFGAEIGISTQKLHARGPMGLEALTTVKYIVFGNGQIR